MASPATSTGAVRPAAVAGLFYPREPDTLRRDLAEYLESAPEPAFGTGFPKVLVVPHAGYVYSGAVAGSAYAQLVPGRGLVRRVVLLGPCHRVPVRGLALPEAAAMDTPLGRVAIDREALASLSGLPQVVVSGAAHAQEHALEVQLPFLQQVLGGFTLVPLVVGSVAPGKVDEVIERLWGGPETLIVISTDLSHYHAYEAARAIDAATVQAVLGYASGISHEQACGATPLAGALLAARRHGLVPRLLDCRNSGDTAGGKAQVVGYASFAFSEPQRGYTAEHGRTLLALARASIAQALGSPAAARDTSAPWLQEWRATFVTLKQGEELRGCVGALEAHRLLAADVMANARAAAFQDNRFKPLTREELERIDVEVSLLSPARRLAFEDHADLIAQLRPGVDGLILECGGRRGTFLPQVWESLPDPEQFIAHLKQKAGLASSERTTRCSIRRYTVLKWREAEFRA